MLRALLIVLCLATPLAAQDLQHDGKTAQEWIALLDSKAGKTRAEAVDALLTLGTRGAPLAKRLIALLSSDPDPQVRLAITIALGSVDEGPATVAALAQALRGDADEEVRRSAADTLGLLAERASQGVPALIEALTQDDALSVRRAAALAFAMMDARAEAAIPPLLKVATDAKQDVMLRGFAIGSLGGLRPRGRTIEVLLKLSRSGETQLRAAALEALSDVGPADVARVVPRLSEAVRDSVPRIGLTAINGLRMFGSAATKAIPVLTAALDNERLAPAAGLALGRIGAPGAVPKLVALVQDGKRAGLSTLCAGLRQLGAPAEAAVPALSRHLAHHPQANVRQAAAAALREIRKGTQRPVKQLATAALTDPDRSVRGLACQGLGAIGGAGAEQALTKALADRETLVRKQAAFGLGLLKRPSTSKALLRALQHDLDPAVRSRAAQALGQAGDTSERVLKALVAATKDAAHPVREHAARALGHLGQTPPFVLKALERLLSPRRSPRVRRGAAEANARLGRPDSLGLHPLIFLLSSNAKAPGERARVLFALEGLAPQSAAVVSAVERVLRRDPQRALRGLACDVLAKIGPKLAKAAYPALERAARQDVDYHVRDRARAALTKLRGAAPR